MENLIANLLEVIVRGLVRNPEEVKIEKIDSSDEDLTVYRIVVAEDDMGRVIGKQGRIAKSIRNIARAAAIKSGEKITVEIG